MAGGAFPLLAWFLRRSAVFRLCLILGCWRAGVVSNPAAAEPADFHGDSARLAATNAAVEYDAGPGFYVATYVVSGNTLFSTNIPLPQFSQYTGTNVSLTEIVKAAAKLQAEYRKHGYPMTSVAIAKGQIINGVVTLNVFQTAVPQIVVSGVRYFTPTNNVETARHPSAPATPEEMVRARAALLQTMAELTAKEKDTRIHVVSTNAGPRFDVEHYLVMGNSILTPETIGGTISNIDGAFGTNVSFDGVQTVAEQLQQAYNERGYVTVAVGLPQQKLTNATIKVQVTEGRLAAINVTGNRYFSSNNVMRALPSLYQNMLLNSHIFQAELNRANANRDRQIYPVIGPGPEPGTSELTLKVKDQLPLHAKIEFNNQNTPGTPAMRVNASAVEDNLWQLEHSLGVQYGFSPNGNKVGNQWDFYDESSVAYYSAFYRMPLGNAEPIENVVANRPGSFGYNEATHQFVLPPPSGRPELNLYASRATIDTGIQPISNTTLFDVPFVREVAQQVDQQGLTVNEALGFQLSKPLPEVNSFHSTLSGGLDYKSYSQSNYRTNTFVFTEWTKGSGQQLIERTFDVATPTPATEQDMDYLPLEINYDAGMNNSLGPATFGLGLSANLWYSSQTSYTSSDTNGNPVVTYKNGRDSLQGITGSKETSGYWVVLRPSFSQQINFDNWTTTFRADGQWASEPLISNEQFGIGGVNSVRGYHEGEVFGDTGWHVSLEQQTPSHVVGMVYDDQPLTIRGSIYMDWATAYLLDPQGRPNSVTLWGTGFGLAASVGSHWQAQFLFSLPLTSTTTTRLDQPYFNFSLISQF